MPFVHSKLFSFPTLKDTYRAQLCLRSRMTKTEHIRDITRLASHRTIQPEALATIPQHFPQTP